MNKVICDQCGMDMTSMEKYLVVEWNPGALLVMADDPKPKHFCSWGCVSRYAQ